MLLPQMLSNLISTCISISLALGVTGDRTKVTASHMLVDSGFVVVTIGATDKVSSAFGVSATKAGRWSTGSWEGS